MKALADCRLYTFVDAAYLDGRSPEMIARQLCDGGSDLIQLRAKGTPVDEVQRMAESLLPITERAGVALVINDHWQIALAMGAPVCHLGQEDFFGHAFSHRSCLLPAHAQIQLGLSSHGPDEAQRAVASGADYVAVGPVYPTGTKPSARPVTLAYVRWAAANLSLPWFAIGGINLQNVEAVLEAGAKRICVVSAVLQAPDVARACQEFRNRLTSARFENPAPPQH